MTIDTLEPWIDDREREFNVAIHQLLEAAADAIDSDDGPPASISATLSIVEEIRAKLIQERAFRNAQGALTEAR